MRLLVGFLRFWYDLIVGDCWRIAVGIVLLLGAGIGIVRYQIVPPAIFPMVLGAGIMMLVSLIIVLEARAERRLDAGRGES